MSIPSRFVLSTNCARLFATVVGSCDVGCSISPNADTTSDTPAALYILLLERRALGCGSAAQFAAWSAGPLAPSPLPTTALSLSVQLRRPRLQCHPHPSFHSLPLLCLPPFLSRRLTTT